MPGRAARRRGRDERLLAVADWLWAAADRLEVWERACWWAAACLGAAWLVAAVLGLLRT